MRLPEIERDSLQQAFDERAVLRVKNGVVGSRIGKFAIGPRDLSNRDLSTDYTSLQVNQIPAVEGLKTPLSDIGDHIVNFPNLARALSAKLYEFQAFKYPHLTLVVGHQSLVDAVLAAYLLAKTDYFEEYVKSPSNVHIMLGRMLAYCGYGPSRTSLVESLVRPAANSYLVIPESASTVDLFKDPRFTKGIMFSNGRARSAHKKATSKGPNQHVTIIALPGSEMKKNEDDQKVMGPVSPRTIEFIEELNRSGLVLPMGIDINETHVLLSKIPGFPKPVGRLALERPFIPEGRSKGIDRYAELLIYRTLQTARIVEDKYIIAGYTPEYTSPVMPYDTQPVS